MLGIIISDLVLDLSPTIINFPFFPSFFVSQIEPLFPTFSLGQDPLGPGLDCQTALLESRHSASHASQEVVMVIVMANIVVSMVNI